MASQPPLQQYPMQPPDSHYPPVNPIAGATKIFGIIYACFTVLAVITAAITILVGATLVNMPSQQVEGVPVRMKILFIVVGIFVLIITTLQAVTAYGLLVRKPWGRTLLIITSVISLISIPFGTILGGVALYFFMRNGAEQDYVRLTLGKP